MSKQTTILCPKCGTQIDVNEILYHQLEDEMKRKFETETTEHKKQHEKAMAEIKAKEEAFKDQQEKFDEKLRDSVSTQLKAERQKLSDTLKKQILDEQSGQMELLQKEIAEKSEQVKELNRSKAEIEQLKREKIEMSEQVEVELQKRISESIKIERDKTEQRLKEQFKIEQDRQNELLQERLNDDKSRTQKLIDEQSEQMNMLQKEIAEKSEQVKELNRSKAEIEQLKREKAEMSEQVEAELQKRLNESINAEREKTEKRLKEQFAIEQNNQLALMQKELEQKAEQLKELTASKIEIERLKREKEEVEQAALLKVEVVLTERLKEEKEKIHKLVDEQNELKLKEKDKQLEDQKKLIEEMKRKAEQGSMQLQGEVQELAIEEWLSVQFPFDTISEVKKGAFGADCLQIVHTREAQNCGVICYESKNTKAWSQEWIKKFKSDMVNSKADIGVLVTSVYPKEMDRMGFVEGVWVCSLEEFKGSVSLLRQSLITTHQATKREENRTDKMSLLYSYLTSNEFNLQLNSIVHGFTSMQEELEKEKRSLMASWKRRQKLIDGVLANTTEMYGSLQGIAGSAISHIEALELPYSGEDEEES